MANVADIVELDEARSRRAGILSDNIKSAGDMLRAVREAAGISLAQASNATNVREMHLENIEAMNIELLPMQAYTVGFVKSYAGFLDLPVEPLVNRFKEQAGYPVNTSVAPEVQMRPMNDLSGGKELSLLAVIAVIFFVIWCAFQITRPAVDPGPLPSSLDTYPIQQRNKAIEATVEGEQLFIQSSADTQNTAIIRDEVKKAISTDTNIDTNTNTEEKQQSSPLSPETVAQTSQPITALSDVEGTSETETTSQSVPQQDIVENIEQEITETQVSEPVLDEIAVEQIIEQDITEATTDITTEITTGAINEATVESVAEVTTDVPSTAVSNEAENTEVSAIETPVTARSNDIIDAIALQKSSPPYPSNCRSPKKEETVLVTFDVNTAGQVINPTITETTNDCFNQSALNAIRKWTFNPAIEGTEPIMTFGRSTSFRFQR